MTQNIAFIELVEKIKQEFPSFEIIPKDTSKHMKFLYKFGLMKYWCPKFMDTYTTLALGKCYMPEYLIGSYQGYKVLRHELVHLRDQKKFGLFFTISYAALLPTVLTMRAFWEFRAYCETLVVSHESHGYVPKEHLESCVQQFTGSSYLFMFPFRKTIRNKFIQFIDRNNMKLR